MSNHTHNGNINGGYNNHHMDPLPPPPLDDQHSYNGVNESGSNETTIDSNDIHSLSLAYQTYMRHDDDEKNHFDDVCRSYRQYATFAMSQWANQQYRFHSLPESQRKILPNALKRDTSEFQQRTTEWKEAAIRNQFCLDCILRHAGVPHSQQVANTTTRIAGDSQISKVSSVLKSLARDWSRDGKAERDMAYTPILTQIQKHMPVVGSNRPKVCVPGAGEYKTCSTSLVFVSLV